MESSSPSDPVLASFHRAIKLYRRGPRYGITARELIDKVFRDLYQFDRFDLVRQVARVIPRSAQAELRRLVEGILRPGAAYVPFFFGVPPDPEAFRERMIAGCRRLAARFREYLDTMPDFGRPDTGRVAVELRAELMPPALDEAKVAQLAKLAARIDGAQPGQWEDDLAEFNRLAGTALPFEDFQGIDGGEEHEDWVRRLLYQQCIKPAANVTRAELAEVVRRATPTNEYFEQHEVYMAIFDANVPLAGASNLIFYPPDYDEKTNTWGGGRPIGEYDPTPEQIVKWALGSTAPLRRTGFRTSRSAEG